MRTTIGAACALAIASVCGFAQTTTANITGQLVDPTGAAVPGAHVVAANVATGVSTDTRTTETGNYSITVYPGVYRVSVEADGFKRASRENITVTASTTVRLDVTLQLGSVSETVEVSGQLLTVQADNAKVSTAIENKFVDELPLVVSGALRNPFNLISIAAQSNETSANNLSLGGGQARAWDATMDGVSIATNRAADQTEIAYNAPSVEAITEVAVDTNGFKAEYGQAGGGVLTFSSKSGTNQFHGSVYEFIRNEKLDARDFFASKRSVLKQHDFGAAGGGPIRRNRTFFFLAYEGFRIRRGANDIIQTVATPEMYQGDFTNWVNPAGARLAIYDPATTRPRTGGGFDRDAFPGNLIPRSRFSPISSKVLTFGEGVKPNRGGTPGTIDYVRNNWITTAGTIEDPQDKGSAKVDHVINDSHRVAFFMNITKYRSQPGAGGPPGLPIPLWTGQVSNFDTNQFRFTHDWVVSPSMVNHFSIGGNIFDKLSAGAAWGIGAGWKDKVGCFGNVIDCDRNFPIITFTEFSNWGGTARNGTTQPLWAFKDDFSVLRGNHNFKFGAAFQSQRANGFGEQCIAGCADFSFTSTGVPGDTTFRSGSSFASFLLGDAIGGGTETERQVYQTYRYHGFYAQDDWRLSPKLTMNIGLRFEFTRPPIDLLDQYSNFTPDKPNPRVNNFPGALSFAGFGEGRENKRSLVPGWYGAWGPRLGMAYALNPKTILRTAFGRSFSKVSVVAGSGHFAGFIGTYRFNTPNNGVTPAFNWDRGLPSYPLPVSVDPSAKLDPAFANNQNVDYWNGIDGSRAPENFYWTFNMQRELSGSTVMELGYSANIGVHLQTGLLNINQVPTSIWNNMVGRLGAAGAANLMRAQITSQLARDNGIVAPYANFTDATVQQTRTVNQALRPYPQYLNVNTGSQGGDKSGHSSYHSMVAKLTRRYSSGVALEWNYVLSKLMTDSDNYNEGDGATMDHYNRGLEKSIGEYDVTHVVKMATVYELPFGTGKRFAGNSNRAANAVIGGWRLSAIQIYQSGTPVAISRNNPLPIFNKASRPVITSYDNWRGAVSGDSFDPGKDRFLNASAFPAQPVDFGNATRHNPKLRTFPLFNENLSLAKTFSLTERFRLDFRWEAFNLFNRVRFGTGNTNLNSNAFGVVTNQANAPRSMQGALKLYW
ncbi:MAG: carboxypeptidase regulatory-like domain-containing protein [Bryobacteraceae bacterium]